jgi:hypothetical protein
MEVRIAAVTDAFKRCRFVDKTVHFDLIDNFAWEAFRFRLEELRRDMCVPGKPSAKNQPAAIARSIKMKKKIVPKMFVDPPAIQSSLLIGDLLETVPDDCSVASVVVPTFPTGVSCSLFEDAIQSWTGSCERLHFVVRLISSSVSLSM